MPGPDTDPEPIIGPPLSTQTWWKNAIGFVSAGNEYIILTDRVHFCRQVHLKQARGKKPGPCQVDIAFGGDDRDHFLRSYQATLIGVYRATCGCCALVFYELDLLTCSTLRMEANPRK